MDKITELSLNEKVKLLSKILLLSQVAENYSEDKKVLKYLHETVSEECKLIEKGEYKLVVEHSRSAGLLANELCDVLHGLIKAKSQDEFLRAKRELYGSMEKITAQLLADEKLLLPPSDKESGRTQHEIYDTVSKVLNSAANGARKLGDMINKGFEHIKNQVLETLNKENSTEE